MGQPKNAKRSGKSGHRSHDHAHSHRHGHAHAHSHGVPYTLRPTREEDLPYLSLMARGQEVGIPPNYLDVGVCAVNKDDIPVGYIHVELTDLGPHVAPVVVFENWRMHGVGSALVKHARETFGPLKLVSNGSSNGFYEKLGFTEIPWEEIEPAFQRDCLACEFYEKCGPKPYLLA